MFTFSRDGSFFAWGNGEKLVFFYVWGVYICNDIYYNIALNKLISFSQILPPVGKYFAYFTIIKQVTVTFAISKIYSVSFGTNIK